MSKLIRKSMGWLLVLAMILAMIPAIPQQAQAADVAITRPADTDVQNGVTLHCWNWSYKNIEANMAKIASLGYTAVQVSPIQQTKQPTLGGPMNDWWACYQPADFKIDNTGVNGLGTKAEFQSLCETAHEYGVYVIVDVVANHMAQDSGSSRSPSVIDDLRNDNSCWHNKNQSIGSNYSSRERITQYDLDSVLDLNTSSKKVQNYVLNFLKECIDAGADGFRFDAVKHIETPDDPSNIASDFWPTVVYGAEEYAASKGLDLYCYGELLDHPDESGTLPDSAYTKYYSITDNSWGNNVRESVVNGGNAGAFNGGYHKNVSADNIVLWAESHDTFTNGSSAGSSTTNLHKTWALVTARADAMSLYFARRQDVDSEMFGNIYTYEWDNPEVAAANKFHNAFAGQSEYVANSGSIAYVERGTSGVVLVNCGGTSTSVSVPANKIANGTYKDQITGNTFTVSGGKITGTIGDTGIAVVYNATECTHPSHTQMGICSSCYATVAHNYVGGKCACGAVQVSEYVIYFKNTSGWSKVNAYAWSDTAGNYTGEWPGTAMTLVSDNIYKITVPGGAEKIIFNDGTNQTADLVIPTAASGLNMFDGTAWTAYGSVTGCDHAEHRFNGNCRACGTAVGHSYVGGVCVCGAEKPVDTTIYYLYGWINGAGAYERNETWRMTNGKITVKFSQESYVGVMAYHGICYQTVDSQRLSNPATIYNASMISHLNVGTASMLTIPGNQEVTITFAPDGKGAFTMSYGAATACDHADHNQSGICTECGQNVGHTLVNGTCSVCGYTKPADRVIYFDNTSGWSKVNAYAWSDTTGEYLGEWPGSAMTKVEGNIYSITVPGDAEKIIFNNGTSQTDDLTLSADANLYTYSTGEWSVYGESDCTHSWGAGKVTTAATCDKAGEKTFTCSLCGDIKYEAIAALGHSWDSGKETTAATCDKDGVKTYTCGTCGDTKTEAIPALGHNYVNGTCSNCGAEESKNTMTIYFQNNWMWSDVCLYYWGSNISACADWPGNAMELYGNDGTYDIYKLEIPADVTGIVINGVKDDGSGERDKTPDITSGWYDGICYYMTWNDGNQTGSEDIEVILPCEHSYTSKVTTAASCGKEGVKTYTCANCGDTYTESIPALSHSYTSKVTTAASCGKEGVKTFTCANCGDTYTESIPALEHNYVDGTCTNCGDKLPVEVVKPTFDVTGTSLSFEDEILYNIYFSVTNPENIVEMGLVTFAEKLSDGTIDNAIDVIPGYVTDGTEYMVQSQGIAAKNMGDALWFKVYAKLSDGSYAYSEVAGYHAVLYAKNMLSKASTTEKMKALIVAMLNYGTEAQLYFGYKTDELMNSFLTAEQKALVGAYDEAMIDAVVSANSAQTAAFPKTSGTFGVSTSVSFDGAFSVNYYFTAKKSVDNGMKLYYWDAATYNSGVALTKENATKVTEMVANGSEYWAQVSGIAAKEIDQTIYVAAVYESEGVEYTSGVTAYSLGHYCKTTAAKETSAMKDFAAATAVYGYYAKQFFAK